MTRYLRERALFGPLIAEEPPDGLGLVVVIPAKDEPDLEESLESLRACDRPNAGVEVIVVVNTGESDSPECVRDNKRVAVEAESWAARNNEPGMRFHILQHHGLPKKHAGVGLARKIGMDEACRRLESAGNPTGVIACFDADSRCAANYLVELESLFLEREDCQACAIHFEHPVTGNGYPPDVYNAVIRYELHLRYYIQAQRFAGFPFAVQTIGSSMAVRCDAYQNQNGMNRRKAGEDFYFLHKFTPLGRVAELTSTRVIPSPRRSHRVPFGTGRAVGDMIDSGEAIQTYSPESFQDLRRFFATLDELFDEPDFATWFADLPESVAGFLSNLPVRERIGEIRSNVTTKEGFRIRFFRWFNAFLIMKYLHATRERFFPDSEVTSAARWLLAEAHGFDPPELESHTARDLLGVYRGIDRSRSGFIH